MPTAFSPANHSALLANETICSTLVQPIESDCCPNNSGPAPTDPPISTDPPAQTDPPTIGATGTPCVFCPLGIDNDELDLSFLDDLNLTIPGGFNNLTCSSLQLGYVSTTHIRMIPDHNYSNLCCLLLPLTVPLFRRVKHAWRTSSR